MIKRQLESEIQALRKEFPIIAILGPRQSGKTTLARALFADYSYVSLEDIDHREFAESDPRGFLDRYRSGVIIDEIQRVPQIVSYLQTHVDGLSGTGEIVITGSHNFLLMEQITQSLSGRVGITTLLPFSMYELQTFDQGLTDVLFSGTYPRIYDQDIRPEAFYKNYIATYVEKDVRQITKITKMNEFMSFLRVLAGRTGQELNLSSISDQCGVAHGTIREWISILEASYLIFRLPPYHKNYNKRIVKNPKVYFTDTGIVCSLLGIRDREQIDYHFLKGALFETLMVSELVKAGFNRGEPFQLYFWRDNHQKEIDVVLECGLKQIGIEIKSGKTIRGDSFKGLEYWKSLAAADSPATCLIYAGNETYDRNATRVVGWKSIERDLIHRVVQKEYQ
ncbi:MAG: ATP-binding protein [Spirochaetaceae bacterium]|nr:MAG: ATP-binding protein [Spirochaetaceae bacterium]